MPEQGLLIAARELLETADIAYLSSIGEDGYPHTRAMFNLRNKRFFPRQIPLFAGHEDDLLLYLSTNTSSAKTRQLRVDPRASVYYCHPTEYRGLLLSGEAEIVTDARVKHAVWNEGWEKYYPEGPEDPDHTVIRIVPRRAEGWLDSRRFAFALE